MAPYVKKGTRGQLFRNVGKVKPRRLPQTGRVGQNIKQKIRQKYTVSGVLGFGGTRG